jgi:hypothetical protein
LVERIPGFSLQEYLIPNALTRCFLCGQNTPNVLKYDRYLPYFVIWVDTHLPNKSPSSQSVTVIGDVRSLTMIGAQSKIGTIQRAGLRMYLLPTITEAQPSETKENGGNSRA